MSAMYYITYAGAPLRFTKKFAQTCTIDEACQFTSEAEAWKQIYESRLTPKHCAVVPLNSQLSTLNPS
ncbi:MAG TPA: hypothetical protein VHY30_09870 [Verrucomicrobiae bacterium]|jgi:hypothetical protein|nr:hypothetical protein [Verrucomicrobiae bacterium]